MLLMNSLTDVPHWSENVCWFYDTDFEYLADESIVRWCAPACGVRTTSCAA